MELYRKLLRMCETGSGVAGNMSYTAVMNTTMSRNIRTVKIEYKYKKGPYI